MVVLVGAHSNTVCAGGVDGTLLVIEALDDIFPVIPGDECDECDECDLGGSAKSTHYPRTIVRVALLLLWKHVL